MQMSTARVLLLVLGGALGLAQATTGCFAEQVAPPSFRFACEDSDDCNEGEQCLDDLCQRPCTQATFASDCPQTGNFAACLNGVCSSLCPLEDDRCPGSQACLELPFEVGGAGNARGEEQPLGLCGIECTAEDGRCPAGESCMAGFCVAACEVDEDCGSGLSCTAGFCVPGSES